MSPSVLRSQTAVVLHGARDLRVEQRTVWPPQQDHVQVEIKATGLCGSDRECPSVHLAALLLPLHCTPTLSDPSLSLLSIPPSRRPAPSLPHSASLPLPVPRATRP